MMEINQNGKRVRSSNFSKEEELLLANEVLKYKNIIECKTTNKTSNVEKEEAWKKVEDGFNAKNFHYRSLQQLKAKFDNLKTKARKEVAQQKSYLYGTGGGPSVKVLDPITEIILDIINFKTVVGFPALTDSDAAICDPIWNFRSS
ncbi:myb/SANT-like DNA-binding domain-containing protein 3 [Coccinella septempunctata]|uniref:myb/SANT-like DNA-binding domain-containing protein 3 n=1 Tax=Coccinella septempunctata TaxID=41139 RepID=UPI001D08542C|nr:myb/SANT-like DNA-binding domain-containing protein 3 [Coccinella septempunctata]